MPNKMDAKVTWVEEMAFDGTPGSGHSVRIDAAPQVGGQNQGPRPLELMLLGLGGCTGMDVISILRKMRQGVTAYEINITAEREEEHPKVFTTIVVEHVVTGHDVSEDAVKKAVELSETKYCAASAMLAKGTDVQHRFRVIEATPVKA